MGVLAHVCWQRNIWQCVARTHFIGTIVESDADFHMAWTVRTKCLQCRREHILTLMGCLDGALMAHCCAARCWQYSDAREHFLELGTSFKDCN